MREEVAELREDSVEIWAPASLSNLGPGFDVLGVALSGIGDLVRARKSGQFGISLTRVDPVGCVPADQDRNTAVVAARRLLEGRSSAFGIELEMDKGIRPGSGLGSSSASAVAGSVSVGAMLGLVKSDPDVVAAALEGESVASGCLHGDNVLPSLIGGYCLVNPSNPLEYRSIAVPREAWIAVILPDVPVLTREARVLLPESVRLSQAVRHAAALAFVIDALRSGDLETAAVFMMSDEIVEPRRAELLPAYRAIKDHALEAGAFGCCLSGSGPAMFAIAGTEACAEGALEAMQAAAGGEVPGFVTTVDTEGARRARPGDSPSEAVSLASPEHGSHRKTNE
jgi:homoserine kinase